MVRRAERSLGVAIREGQEIGTIASRSTAAHIAATNREARKRGDQEVLDPKSLPSASSFFTSGDDGNKTYSVTDDVTDSEFDAALDAAKEERNLSRANVVRVSIRSTDAMRTSP
ncbi:hypothetical protein [Pseudarthrobacter albicanus]|uniref:hypothetical protein n=1 Tax=Pseudarthrobacter albicanus TaxID=2823873 RepID=UPI001BA69A7D|nr:hypothetical protein [Pseudarthrobacter albicanus]